jgi:pimeloyl-ACP methyl ester carboxylesterase
LFVSFFWLGLLLTMLPGLLVSLWMAGLYAYLRRNYLHYIVRIFQEKPLFIVPRGQPVPGAEDVRFAAPDGRTLCGCYLRARPPRRGVILFGLEFGSNRWACLPYCEALLDDGYDVFAFESRSQGDSEPQPGYEPLQWVTAYEVEDTRAALAYLRGRPDADPAGVGFFGISKGAGAGLFAAGRDPSVRCCVTDGAFATYTTLVPYMRLWFRIYNDLHLMHGLLPSWYYGLVGLAALRRIEQERGCRYPHLEPQLGRLGPRPLLMIHGAADTYIKPDMARALFQRVRGPKDLWLVEGANHNQALQTAGPEYARRVLEFFDRHLGRPRAASAPEDRRALPAPHAPQRTEEHARKKPPLAPASGERGRG